MINMINRKKIIHIVISIFAILFPAGYLLGIISEKVAFPIMFTLLGCQKLFHGLFIMSKENKYLRAFSIIIGSLFISLGLFIFLPAYYF